MGRIFKKLGPSSVTDDWVGEVVRIEWSNGEPCSFARFQGADPMGILIWESLEAEQGQEVLIPWGRIKSLRVIYGNDPLIRIGRGLEPRASKRIDWPQVEHKSHG